MSDLIKRADAIEMAVDVETPQGTYERAIYVDDLMALPSADAEQTETSTFGEKHQLSHGRLIDADELKKHLDGAWEELNDDGERKGVRLARWYLISAPTVDSTIDVVRCKDCEYYKCCEVFNPKKITENDFCSWAKMKGGTE